MKIALKPEIELLIKAKSKDVEQFVNDLLFTYLHDGFIKKGDVVGMFVTDKLIRKSVQVGTGVYDNITKEFSGVSVEGRVNTEALFIIDERLLEALEEHQVILVLNSPRDNGIRIEDSLDIHITDHEKH
jgi:hypothetical protein